MEYVIVISIFIATYFLLKFMQIIVRKLNKKHLIFRNIDRYMSLIVSVLWPLIFLWSINFLFNSKPFYNLIIGTTIVLVGVLIGWFFLRDFIAGIVFRIQNSFKKGDYVEFGSLKGQVVSILLTHIVLKNEESKIQKLPYSKISNEIISQNTDTKSYEEKIFVLETGKKKTLVQTKTKIENLLLVSPWRIANSTPVVKFIDENPDTYKFEIKVQARSSGQIKYIQNALKSKFR